MADDLNNPGWRGFEFVCDRCHQTKTGGELPGVATSGYYDVRPPRLEGAHSWNKYANPGEKMICDACMQSDPRYQADYSGTPAAAKKGT